MALSLGTADFSFLHFPISQVIDFEIFGPAEMLEYFPILWIISHCKFHVVSSIF